jgi:hypothetical protein
VRPVLSRRFIILGSLSAAFLLIAANAPQSYPSSAPYVTPAGAPPQVPQVIGQDAGLSGTLTFPSGANLRVSAFGQWCYNVGAFITLTDAGTGWSDGGNAALPCNDLPDGTIESFTLNGAQSQVFATGFDGGQFKAAQRGL